VPLAFKKYDNVVYRNASAEANSGRRHVRCYRPAVLGILFIGLARSQLAGEFRGVLSTSKFV
jgi:hypothetical protein